MRCFLLCILSLTLAAADSRWEYDADGWLVGSHSDLARPRSTALAPSGIPPARARWNGSAWVEDATKETAAIAEDTGRRLSQRVVSIATAKLAAADRSMDEALLRVLYDLCQALPAQKQTPRTQAFVTLIDQAIAEAGN